MHELAAIPLLDMNDPAFADQLVSTFRQIGFVMIRNHGLESSKIDEAFRLSKEFFKLEPQVKSAIKFDASVNRGYMCAGK